MQLLSRQVYISKSIVMKQKNSTKLSSYVLTSNSELYLEVILQQLTKMSDEIIVLDSGSVDRTRSIAEKFDKVIFHVRAFDNFKNQRNYAASLCSYEMISFVDSDEIPDDEMINSILRLKENGFDCHAYDVQRVWFVMGKEVHCIYPIQNPDYPVRIFNKNYASFDENSHFVHETLTGYQSKEIISGKIIHNTFHDHFELMKKMNQYTSLAALDMLHNHRKINHVKLIFSPIFAFIKWYLLKKGFLDGRVGLILGSYAYHYTFEKYRKALKMK